MPLPLGHGCRIDLRGELYDVLLPQATFLVQGQDGLHARAKLRASGVVLIRLLACALTQLVCPIGG